MVQTKTITTFHVFALNRAPKCPVQQVKYLRWLQAIRTNNSMALDLALATNSLEEFHPHGKD